MPNVEILCMSVNELTTLEDFSYCPKLQELYLRKNKVENIAEIAHLQNLPNLKNLWFDENPCVANTYNYRKVVLRALPNLSTLDNIPVTREEIKEIEELGDEIYEEIYRPDTAIRSSDASVQESDSYEDGRYENDANNYDQDNNINAISHQSNDSGCESSQSSSTLPITNNCGNVAQTNFCHTNSSATLPNDISRLNISTTPNNNKSQSRNVTSHSNNNLSTISISQQGWSQQTVNNNPATNNNSPANSIHLPKGGKNRNANILSAVLCLIKELDYVSCEVVQTALHCRIEETMNS